MSKHYLVSAVALTIFGTATAHAEEFTGPRIEVRGGWDHARIEKGEDAADGLAYGIAAGYDFAIGRSLIAGVEAGVDLFDNDSSGVSGNTSFTTSAKRDFEVAARIGYKLSDNLLAYAKAGYSNARFKETLIVGGTAGTTRTETGANLDGIRIGLGIEASVYKRIYAKTEYRYTNYEQGASRQQVMAALGFRF